MAKEADIKKEIDKLNDIFCDIPDNKKKLVEGLIQNAAFMSVTLRDLQAEVVANGAVIIAPGGNGFDIAKDNPAQKAYTTMISRYDAVIRHLESLVPEDEGIDELKAFLEEED